MEIMPEYTFDATFGSQNCIHFSQGGKVKVIDQAKIGKFISEMRKKQGKTQKQLADQLNVTDKTISKWETGYRLPDASILLELSSALEVDINELLAGEEFLPKELSPEEYGKKAEHNIVGLVSELNEIDKRSRSRIIGTIVGTSLTGVALLLLFSTSLQTGRFIDIIDLPTLVYLLGLKFAVLSISGWFHDYLNAWKVCFPGKHLSENGLESAMQAISYASALTLTLGCLFTLLGLFSLLNYMDNSNLVCQSLAQIILALLYTAIIKTIYIILTFRIKRMIRNIK